MTALETPTKPLNALEVDVARAMDRVKLYRSAEFQSKLAERIDTMLKGRTVLSLDVFDTLILRDNTAEIARFFEVAGKMAKLASSATGREITQVDAFLARQMGTEATYRASLRKQGCREGSFTEIHATASRLLTGSDDLCADFMDAELENETHRIVPNPFFESYIEAARARGITILLLSDMYMHAAHIEDLLSRLGIDNDAYDVLISSADTKVSKASGGVFSLVEKELGVRENDVVHIGDSRTGDVLRPIQHGWSALHLPLSDRDIALRKQAEKEFSVMMAKNYNISID